MGDNWFIKIKCSLSERRATTVANQTIKLSNYQTIKLSNYQTIKLSNYQTIKLSNYQLSATRQHESQNVQQ
jgi:hypothetical protein